MSIKNDATSSQPSKILNIAATTSGTTAALFTNRKTPNTIPYKFESADVDSLNKDVLFIEQGPCVLHALKRSLIICISIAMSVGGIVSAPFIFEDGFTLSAVLFVIGFMTICGVPVGLCLLWIAWIFRTLVLWPIYIFRDETSIRAQLIYRRPWCPLSDLSPSLATSTFNFIDKNGEVFNPNRLPDSLKPITHACWLQLRHQTRRRWVILSLHENEKDASQSILDWVQKFELVENHAFSSDDPPVKALYFYNPKLF